MMAALIANNTLVGGLAMKENQMLQNACNDKF